jgi:hypothetical protein
MLIRNYYASLFLLVPGQVCQENLLARQDTKVAEVAE